jgi:hypothetical protein
VPKRNLRVTKWIGTVPAMAVCTACNREFKVPVSMLRSVVDSQESLRRQFAAHRCPEGANPGGTEDATEGKVMP